MSLAEREPIMAESVLPLERSRATSTGICSADKPGFDAGVPRTFAGRGNPPRWPLNDSKKNVSSASTTPESLAGWMRRGAARSREEAVPPTEGRGAGHAQPLGCLGDAHALHHALGVLDVLLGVAQPRQGRAREGVECLLAGFAPETLPLVDDASFDEAHAAAVWARLDGLLRFAHQQVPVIT